MPVRSASSVVLIFAGAGETEGSIHDLSDGTVAYLTVSRALLGERTLYALYYDCEPAALGLEPGALVFGSGGSLPEARAMFAAPSGELLAPIDVLPETLRTLQVVGVADPTCRALIDTRFVVPRDAGGGAEVRFVQAVGEGSALFATANGRFSVIEDGAVRALTAISTATPNLGAVLLDNGEVWLAGRGGAVSSGQIESGFFARPTRTSTRGMTRIWLDGATEAEIFLVSDQRSFERFDGSRWTVLYEGSGEIVRSRGGVARIGEGAAIAVGPAAPALVRYREGTATVEMLPEGAAISVARIDGLGVVAGNELGSLFLDTAEGWRALEVNATTGVRAVAVLRGTGADAKTAVLFGGEAGVMHRFALPALGLCDALSLGPDDLSYASSFGANAFLLANVTGGDDVIVQVALPPPICGGTR